MPKIITTAEFIERATLLHGNKYNYSKTQYIDSHTKVIIICPEHDEFDQSPNAHLKGQSCPECGFEKVGNINKNSKEEFLEKAIEIHGNKYDYSKVNYINSWTKIIIICPEHGEFEQTPNNHLKGQRCGLCHGNINLSKEEFIEKAIAIHDYKYDYDKVEYINNSTKVTIICPKHGEFEQIPKNHLAPQGCPICKSSKGELAILGILEKYNINYKREYRIVDEKYLLYYDFYLPDHNVLIEFHGRQHYEFIPYFHKTLEGFNEAKKRDLFKIWLAKEKHIKLIEFNHKQFKHMTKEQFEKMLVLFIKN